MGENIVPSNNVQLYISLLGPACIVGQTYLDSSEVVRTSEHGDFFQNFRAFQWEKLNLEANNRQVNLIWQHHEKKWRCQVNKLGKLILSSAES